ncbi:hypothetical protein FYK55_00405 [Roseiconus nitratireducens]|uniref:Uncharacterized protein n=1 Tax=Roseiconus nitratireducens TaxID=2605748 RepID=A0A5M6DKY6_9BACT|nr:hypothetical protein [Roseiconus nitratireducens]KAA5546922.1 hypothetical protein FYK55_00405 [Roseiconus nitratireducens]
MKKTAAAMVALALLAVGSTSFALYSVSETGTWPDSWPTELEPLRKQARTFIGPQLSFRHYAIRFSDRDAFEAAWPNLIKVKSRGAPIFLVREPNFFLGENTAGVVIHCPPEGQWDDPKTPEAPRKNDKNPRSRWLFTNYIDLVVDGEVVDLNRIPLPRDTPIIDERFKSLDGTGDDSETP